ncbi:MAG: hypothetical protein ABFD82_21710 [Syntrophaceae bacterium]
MRHIAVIALIFFWSSLAVAGVINVEFQFTPFTGDPIKSNQVETVAGKARVFINNVILAEQQVLSKTVPVLFEEREVAPSVWVTMAGLEPRLRKGKNMIRIEFEPENNKTPYSARLAWASVTDQVTKQEEPGRYRETNQAGQGADTKTATGKVILEREFVADFAADLPWHHYPPVTSLGNEDKQSLMTIIGERAKAFKPNFAGIYQLLAGTEGIKVNAVRTAKCLDKAYAVGIRIGVPGKDQFEFITTGNPEIVVQRKGGDLFSLDNQNLLERVGDDDMQMCAAMALYLAFPPRVAVIRTPIGGWEVVY